MEIEGIHNVPQGKCNLCMNTTEITLCNLFHEAPCMLYKRLIAVQSSAGNLYNTCITLASESPISAIETLRGDLGSLEFVAVYENEATRQEFGDQIRIAFEDNGNAQKDGKLWIRHSVVKEIVLESSFIDWISNSTNKSQNNTISPYRMHLLVIKEYNLATISKLIELIYTHNSLVGFYIPLFINNFENSKVNLNEEFNIKHILSKFNELCIILQNDVYIISLSVLALISFRVQLWSRFLVKLIEAIDFQNLKHDVKLVCAEIIIKHFSKNLKIYQSGLFKHFKPINNVCQFINDENIELRNFGRYFQSYISNSEITVAWIIEKLNLQLQTWNELCLKCAGTVNIVSVSHYVLKSNNLFYYRHPSCNFNPLLPMIKVYNELFEVCQILAKETPMLAIESLRQYMNSLEFDALYENTNICQQIGDKIRTTLTNTDDEEIIGKLRSSHWIRENIVLGISFLDWFRSEEVQETIGLSPYRLHLLVINGRDYTPIQIRNLLDFIYCKKGTKGGIFIPVIFHETNTLYRMLNNDLLISSELEQANSLTNEELINLWNCIFMLSISVINGIYYIGKYTLRLLLFQKECYIEFLLKILNSTNFEKHTNDLSITRKSLDILIYDILDYSRLESSKVFEMSCNYAQYLFTELNNILVSEFVMPDIILLTEFVPSAKLSEFFKFISHVLFERTSFTHLLNIVMLIWPEWGFPILYLANLNEIKDFKSLKLSPHKNYKNNRMFDKFFQMLFNNSSDYKNLSKYITTFLCSLIEYHNLYGDSMVLSVEGLRQLPGYNGINNYFNNLFEEFVKHLNNPFISGGLGYPLREPESTQLPNQICQDIVSEIRQNAQVYSFDSIQAQCLAICFELVSNINGNYHLSDYIRKVVEIIQNSQVNSGTDTPTSSSSIKIIEFLCRPLEKEDIEGQQDDEKYSVNETTTLEKVGFSQREPSNPPVQSDGH